MISKSGKLLLPGDQDALNTLPIVLFCTLLSHTHKEIAFGCWETINCSLTESITLLTAFSQKRKKTSFTLLFKTYLLFMYLFLQLPRRLKHRRINDNKIDGLFLLQYSCNLDFFYDSFLKLENKVLREDFNL